MGRFIGLAIFLFFFFLLLLICPFFTNWYSSGNFRKIRRRRQFMLFCLIVESFYWFGHFSFIFFYDYYCRSLSVGVRMEIWGKSIINWPMKAVLWDCVCYYDCYYEGRIDSLIDDRSKASVRSRRTFLSFIFISVALVQPFSLAILLTVELYHRDFVFFKTTMTFLPSGF